jgi:hypothetical protein
VQQTQTPQEVKILSGAISELTISGRGQMVRGEPLRLVGRESSVLAPGGGVRNDRTLISAAPGEVTSNAELLAT